jgi:hypothetical protein
MYHFFLLEECFMLSCCTIHSINAFSHHLLFLYIPSFSESKTMSLNQPNSSFSTFCQCYIRISIECTQRNLQCFRTHLWLQRPFAICPFLIGINLRQFFFILNYWWFNNRKQKWILKWFLVITNITFCFGQN